MPVLDWRCGSEDQGLRVQEALGSVLGTPRKKVEPVLRVPNSLPPVLRMGPRFTHHR